MKHKNFLTLFIIAVLASYMMSSCSIDADLEPPLQSKIYVNVDPTDYSIANIFTLDGDSIFVFGDKDSLGYPTHMRDVIISPHDGEGATEIFFDENDRPVRVVAPNQVVMLFDWIESEKAALTLISPDGEEQLNTVIDYSQNDKNIEKSEEETKNPPVMRTGKSKMSVVPIKNSNEICVKESATTKGDMVGQLTIEDCGVPNNAECWVDVYSYSGLPFTESGTRLSRLRCVNKGVGQYEYMLPQGVRGIHHAPVDEFCDGIMQILNTLCVANNGLLGPSLCTSIAAASTALLTPAGAGIFLSACLGINEAFEICCNIVAYGNYGFTVGDGICDFLREMNIEWDEDLLFIPWVNALPHCVQGVPKKWDGTAPTLPYLEVLMIGYPRILQFILVPAAPMHGQSYVATAELNCLPAGSKITMSIVGTDGYSDSDVFHVVGNQLHYSASLSVPGAKESGVKDICTIKLELPDGSVKTKKASLVFQ